VIDIGIAKGHGVNSYISRDADEGRLLQATDVGGTLGAENSSSGLGQDESLTVILSNDHKIVYYLAPLGPGAFTSC